MYLIKRKFLDLIKETKFIKKINYNKFIFYFLFNLKSQFEKFKININTKCLVFSQYPGAETKGLGGLMAQYPKNFEVLCMTNGSTILSELNPIDSSSIKKQQFQDVMKDMRIKGFKIFDIDDKTLKNHYSTFKKIDISEADYIFIPNLYDNNPDTISLISHFRHLLKEKEHKKDLKIMLFESDFPMPTLDYYVDISQIVETKKKFLKEFYPENKFSGLVEKIMGINYFRSIKHNINACEAFMCFSVDEFLKIPFV